MHVIVYSASNTHEQFVAHSVFKAIILPVHGTAAKSMRDVRKMLNLTQKYFSWHWHTFTVANRLKYEQRCLYLHIAIFWTYLVVLPIFRFIFLAIKKMKCANLHEHALIHLHRKSLRFINSAHLARCWISWFVSSMGMCVVAPDYVHVANN